MLVMGRRSVRGRGRGRRLKYLGKVVTESSIGVPAPFDKGNEMEVEPRSSIDNMEFW